MNKKLILLGIGLISLLFTIPSCEKDKDKEEEILISEIILGKWEVLKDRNTVYVNNQIYEDSTYNYDEDEMVVEFLSGGNGKIYEYNVYDDDFTWQLNNDILTMALPEVGEIDFEPSYDKATQKITLTYSETWTDDNINYKYEMIITAVKL